MLVLDEQTDGNVMLDLLLLNKEELLWCHLTAISWGGCSRSWGKWESQVIITQNFKLVDFGLFNELAGKNLLPWKAETHESCLVFKDSLKAQEQSILMFRILSRYSRRPSWLNRELLPDFRCKKKREECGAGSRDKQPKENTEMFPGCSTRVLQLKQKCSMPRYGGTISEPGEIWESWWTPHPMCISNVAPAEMKANCLLLCLDRIDCSFLRTPIKMAVEHWSTLASLGLVEILVNWSKLRAAVLVRASLCDTWGEVGGDVSLSVGNKIMFFHHLKGDVGEDKAKFFSGTQRKDRRQLP